MSEKSEQSLNLDDIMAAIDAGSTPEEELIAKIAGVAPAEKEEEQTPEKEGEKEAEKEGEKEGEKEPEKEPEKEAESSEEEDLQKAAEVDDQGRIMARAFFDELNKIAVGDVGITPNPAAEGDNPAVQLSNKGGVGAAAFGPADAVIQQLTASVQAGGPQGTVGVEGGGLQGVAGVAGVDTAPLAADAAKAKENAMADKTASDEVINALYKRFVEGSE